MKFCCKHPIYCCKSRFL